MRITQRLARKLLSVVWRIATRLQPEKVMTFRLPDGSSFVYPLRSALGWSWFTGGYELAECEFVMQSLHPGDIVFDIGANGGVFTLIAAKQVMPSGHVYAFEPGARERQLLRRNLEANNITNVTILDYAVSNKDGWSKFAISLDGAMNSLAKNDHNGQKIICWQEVKVITLDSFLRQEAIHQVDFIKIDVEGAERLVISGAESLLSQPNAPTIMCEFADSTASGFQSSGRELWDAFVSLGYELYGLVGTRPVRLEKKVRQAHYIYENLIAKKST